MALDYLYLQLNEQQKVMNEKSLMNLAILERPADAVLYNALMNLLVMSLGLDLRTKSRFVINSS